MSVQILAKNYWRQTMCPNNFYVAPHLTLTEILRNSAIVLNLDSNSGKRAPSPCSLTAVQDRALQAKRRVQNSPCWPKVFLSWIISGVGAL